MTQGPSGGAGGAGGAATAGPATNMAALGIGTGGGSGTSSSQDLVIGRLGGGNNQAFNIQALANAIAQSSKTGSPFPLSGSATVNSSFKGAAAGFLNGQFQQVVATNASELNAQAAPVNAQAAPVNAGAAPVNAHAATLNANASFSPTQLPRNGGGRFL